MCRVMHACGHAYTPGLWLAGCPWCSMAPRQDTPIEGRYFDTHKGAAYISGAQLLELCPDLRELLGSMRSGQSRTFGKGQDAQTITRVL